MKEFDKLDWENIDTYLYLSEFYSWLNQIKFNLYNIEYKKPDITNRFNKEYIIILNQPVTI